VNCPGETLKTKHMTSEQVIKMIEANGKEISTVVIKAMEGRTPQEAVSYLEQYPGEAWDISFAGKDSLKIILIAIE